MVDRRRVILGLALVLGIAGFCGCGGSGTGGGITVNFPSVLIGIYAGQMDGDGTGPLRFYIDPRGGLIGNFRLPPICAGPIQITGTVDPDGNVIITGSGCGFTFSGTGTLAQTASGSVVYTGSGTWTGSNGTSGTWSATRTGATGAISV